MRKPLDRARLRRLFHEIAATAPRHQRFRVYLTGGASAVEQGWRDATLDADLTADRDEVFTEVQRIKERLNINIELVKPTDFVPSLTGEADRHRYIETAGKVDYFHFDPYAQAFSKIVRGFERDLKDARQMADIGWVDLDTLAGLVADIPAAIFAKFPSLSQKGVIAGVNEFRTPKAPRRR